MTDTTVAQDEPILVAIDIAKARHEVLIAVPGKKRRRRLTVPNKLEEFNRLIATLSDYGSPVRVAVEATGNYHRALAYRLGIAGFEVKLDSSVALERTREALNNSWDKNDPKDAQVIPHMMQIGNEQFYHDPMLCGTNDLQELAQTHDIVSRSKTELWRRVLTPRRMNRSVNASIPSVEFSFRFTRIAKHFRLSSSKMLSVRNAFPSSIRDCNHPAPR